MNWIDYAVRKPISNDFVCIKHIDEYGDHWVGIARFDSDMREFETNGQCEVFVYFQDDFTTIAQHEIHYWMPLPDQPDDE